MAGQILTCGPFAVDPATHIARRDGQPLAVGLRGALILQALLSRPGDVLTKGELLDAAWGGAAVEESNLSVQIAALRKALGATPAVGEWIVTVPRIGYRFAGTADTAARATDKRPAIAVLPFTNLGTNPDHAFFADGLAEEIITSLGKLPELLVIARNSSFAYRGDTVDLRKVASELDVGYILTGSVRRSQSRVRMSLQFADAATGVQLWGETLDRPLTDIFALEDEVTRHVVSALRLTLGPTLPRIGTTDDITTFDLHMRARALLAMPHQDAAIVREALDLLQRALARDPKYAAAHVRAVLAHITSFSNGWGDRALSLAEARRHADAATASAPEDADAHAARSLVASFEKDRETQRQEALLALALNPDLGLGNTSYGGWLVDEGRALESIPYYERSIRVDPGMAHLLLHHLGTAYLFAGRYETAAALFRARIQLTPDTDMTRGYLCVALGHLGAYEEARQVWGELMAINPGYSLSDRLSRIAYRNPADPERIKDGLRKAGLPA